MDHEHEIGGDCPVSEMAIVDTFTKLIFGQEQDYSPRELSIVQAFRMVEANVQRDSHLEMGEYLRNLGVREMIQLVSRLREYMGESVDSLPSGHVQAVRSAEVNPPR